MRKIGCFWLVGVLCFGQLGAGGEVESGDVKAVLSRGYKEARAVFDDVRMVCLLKSWHDSAWWKAELDVEMQSEVQYSACIYAAKDERERIDGMHVGREKPEAEDYAGWLAAIGKGESRAFTVADGKRVLAWYSTKGSRDSTTQVGRATVEDSAERLLDSDRRVSKFVGYDSWVTPEKVLASGGLQIREEMEVINGYRCYCVSGPVEYNKATVFVAYWLCPERSCLPVTMEMRSEGGDVVKKTETREFMRLEDGRWVIKEVVQRDYEAGHGLEIANWTASILRIEKGAGIDEELFSMDLTKLPTGTVVYDRTAKTECTVREGRLVYER